MKMHLNLVLALALLAGGCAEADQTKVKKNVGENVPGEAPTSQPTPPPAPATPATPATDPMETACTAFCNQFTSCLTNIGCGQLAGTMSQCVSNCMTQYSVNEAPALANISCDAVNTQVCNGPQAAEVQEQCACEPFLDQGDCSEGLTCYPTSGSAVCLDLTNTATHGVPANATTCASAADCEEGQACITVQSGGNFCVHEC
jgi:hypothetical protein